MDEPSDIYHASSHADPWSWYARLRAGPPVWHDVRTGGWIVCGPRAVCEALRHPALRVRPPGEPVPAALAGTPVGEVFAQLLRMNDGPFHRAHRPDLEQALAAWTDEAVAGAARQAARDLVSRADADAWIHGVPVQTVARLLAVPETVLDATVTAVQAFTRAIAPGASVQAIEEAGVATRTLMAQGRLAGLSEVQAAQRIALMQQAMDATAGLLGQALARLARWPEVGRLGLAGLVEVVARETPPVHHTRRWAAEALELAGTELPAGAALVVVLVGVAPFGAGAHQCPGERVARCIAAAALDAVRDTETWPRLARSPTGWRALPNARVPVFGPVSP